MATFDQDLVSSSPDVLGQPSNNARSSPVRCVKRPRSTTPKKQIKQAAGTYQLQDFYLDTPTGTIARSKSPSKAIAQAENLVSPWRIRVRVEAERDDEGTGPGRKSGNIMSASPSKQIARTVTTTVPLKESDDIAVPQKRGRGRPRKSGTPAKTPAKRPSTPKPGRGRKKAAEDINGNVSDASQRSTVPKSTRQKQGTTPKTARNEKSAETEDNSNMGWLRQPSATSLSTRAETSNNVFDIATDPSIGPDSTKPSRQSQRHPTNAEPSDSTTVPVSLPRKGCEPLVPRSPQKGRQIDVLQEASKPHYSDAAEEGSEFDSIAEGEDFSIVSLSTLPSAQQHLGTRGPSGLNSTALRESENAVPKKGHVRKASDSRYLKNKGEQPSYSHSVEQAKSLGNLEASRMTDDRLSAYQSSLLHIDLKRTTASQMFSSPALPPIKPLARESSSNTQEESRDTMTHATRSARVSTALQDIVDLPSSTKTNIISTSEKPAPSAHNSVSTGLNNMFGGFGVRTRRELRVGLRFGEELAKRQQLNEETTQNMPESEDDIFQAFAKNSQQQSSNPNKSPLRETACDDIQYPQLRLREQLPSPETSLDGSFEHLTKGNNMGKAASAPSPTSSELRRQAVSKQIEAANSSQVKVINSDDPTIHFADQYYSEDEASPRNQPLRRDDTDIWQTEAKSAPNSQNNSQDFTASIRAGPRSAQLPSPWRYNIGIEQQDQGEEASSVQSHQGDTNSLLNRSGMARYSTPSPRKQSRHQNPNFTGLTNFTNDMLAAEDSQPSQVLTSATKGTKRARMEDSPEKLVPAKKQRKALGQASLARTSSTNTRTNVRREDGPERPKQATVPPKPSLVLPSQQQPSHQHVENPSSTHHTSWLDALSSIPLLQAASSTFNIFTSSEHTQNLNQATFSASPHPQDKWSTSALFTKHLPFNTTHYNRLRAIYIRAQRHPQLYRLKPTSPCAEYLGLEVESMGWKRKLQALELAVVDDFMQRLRIEGVTEDEGGDGE
ncbi:MAG: hypothetical protein LQ340_004267, partial [Diploschistes diacapsis]